MREETSEKVQKTLWDSNWVKIWIKGFIHHKFIIFIKFAIKLKFEYGINSIETAYLFDNIRYGSRWIRIVIGLNCDEGVGFSQRVQDRANLEGSTTRREGLSWTIECGLARVGSLESEGEASLCVEVYSHSLLLIRYRVIRFNCKLCTCVHHFWSIYSQITRLVIWGEAYSANCVDDAKAGELPNQTLVSFSLSSFTFY